MRSRQVHTSFLDVGCDVIETNSFGGSEVVLTEFGIAEKTYDVNLKAAELAKRVASGLFDAGQAAVCRRLDRAGNEAADARAHHLPRS